MFVCIEAFDGEQRTAACFRPETPDPFQPRKMGCTLRLRQTLQICQRVRMAELRVLILGSHDSLDCSHPDARSLPSAGLRKHAPGSLHAEPRKARLQPRNTRRAG